MEWELPPGRKHHAVWLDPELPATFDLLEQVLAGLAAFFPSPSVLVGGDEPYRMPHGLYASYVRRLRRLVRILGKQPLGWQESARAGLGPDDIIQYWFTDIALPASLPPQVRAQMDTDLALSRRDVQTAVAASVPVIVSPLSHCYLDVPYAEPPADPAQADRQGRVGLRLYAPRTVAEAFEWEPPAPLGAGRAARSLAKSKPPSGPRPFLASTTYPSCCCRAWPASPTRPGATRSSPAGPATVTASPGTAGCGYKTTSRTSAPPPWTGSELPASTPFPRRPYRPRACLDPPPMPSERRARATEAIRIIGSALGARHVAAGMA